MGPPVALAMLSRDSVVVKGGNVRVRGTTGISVLILTLATLTVTEVQLLRAVAASGSQPEGAQLARMLLLASTGKGLVITDWMFPAPQSPATTMRAGRVASLAVFQ